MVVLLLGWLLSAQVREWQSELRKAQRGVDNDVREIEREEAKLKAEMRTAAKKGERAALATMAKEMVCARSGGPSGVASASEGTTRVWASAVADPLAEGEGAPAHDQGAAELGVDAAAD